MGLSSSSTHGGTENKYINVFTYHIKKLPSMGWMEKRRSGLWCQSLRRHSILASRESGACPAVGPESVASELMDVVALKQISICNKINHRHFLIIYKMN